MVTEEELIVKGYVKNKLRKVTYFTSDGVVVAKTCTKCRKLSLLREFGKHVECLGGVRSNCKECHGEAQKMYVEANVEKVKTGRRKYHIRNRDRLNEKTREWYASNKEKHKGYGDEWKRRNIEHVAHYKGLWYLENRDRISVRSREIYDRNPEKKRKYSLAYAKANPKMMAAARHRREARKRNLPDTLTKGELAEVLSSFNGACCLTGTKDAVQIDHVIPLAIGHGGTIKENIIPLESRLNNSKHAGHIFEWFEGNKDRFKLDQNKFDELIKYLADINEMSTREYRKYLDWCFDNPRTITKEEFE